MTKYSFRFLLSVTCLYPRALQKQRQVLNALIVLLNITTVVLPRSGSFLVSCGLDNLAGFHDTKILFNVSEIVNLLPSVWLAFPKLKKVYKCIVYDSLGLCWSGDTNNEIWNEGINRRVTRKKIWHCSSEIDGDMWEGWTKLRRSRR